MIQSILTRSQEEISGSVRDRSTLCEEWLRFIARNMHTCTLEHRIPEASSFQIRGRLRSFHGFAIMRGITTAGRCRLRRDTGEIATDGQDCFGVFMSLRGGVDITQLGRTHLIRPGTFTLASASEPTVYNKGGRNDSITFLMPRSFVTERISCAEQLCVRPRPVGPGLQSLVFETISSFERNAWHISDEDFEKSARAVGDLTLLAFNGPFEVSSRESSIRSHNLARVKRIIHQRLSEPDLTLADVAHDAGLSLSYAHELFRSEGEPLTMREYLTQQRLQRARELLELRSNRRLSVTEVALECGFSNISYFSTAFRRAFGAPPRDVMRRDDRQ